MNVLVDMYISVLARSMGGRVCISGVDFGCFSASYRDCEALEKREEQTNFTLFVCIYTSINQYIPIPEGVRRENKI